MTDKLPEPLNTALIAGKQLDAQAAELARLRAELEQAPTATLRQQLAGSQSALSKVMGELTEAREQLERRRIDYAKVQADLYNQIEAEKAQTAEAYRQRDVARAALAEAERERDEARKQRDFAKDGEDNMRFLKVLWENECGFYRAQSVARLHEIDMSRRTIRALVVAARVARLAAVGFAFIAGVGPRRVHDEIRFGIKQADHRAGKE